MVVDKKEKIQFRHNHGRDVKKKKSWGGEREKH